MAGSVYVTLGNKIVIYLNKINECALSEFSKANCLSTQVQKYFKLSVCLDS